MRRGRDGGVGVGGDSEGFTLKSKMCRCVRAGAVAIIMLGRPNNRRTTRGHFWGDKQGH